MLTYLESLLSTSVDLYGDDLYNDLICKVGDSKGVHSSYYADIKLAIENKENDINYTTEHAGLKYDIGCRPDNCHISSQFSLTSGCE